MRMGPHVNNISPEVEAMFETYVRMVRPPWVKILDDAVSRRMIDVCRSTGTLILGRNFVENQGLGATGAANIQRFAHYARKHPEFDAIEGYNECYDSPGEIGRYAEWCIEFMKAMQGIGRRACIGSFSTGTPEPSEWIEFLPALEWAWKNGHYLGLHEYGLGKWGMRWGAGNNQWNDGRPTTDDPADRPDTVGWWCLRYRRFLLPLLREKGIGARIIITESGIDNIFPDAGWPGTGWRDSMDAQRYSKECVWYGRHLSLDAAERDDRSPIEATNGIHGWVGFGDGSRRAGGDERWKKFDILEAGDLVVIARGQLELPVTTGRSQAAPAPSEPPPASRPPDGNAAFISAEVLAGESWYAFCRRVYNLPMDSAPLSRVSEAVRAVALANGLDHRRDALPQGRTLRVPGWATLWRGER